MASVPDPSRQRRARAMLAEEIAAQGPAWRNAAEAVRSGSFANCWIAAALSALERVLPFEED